MNRYAFGFLSGLAACSLTIAGCAGSKSRIQQEAGMGGEVVEAEGSAPYNASNVPGSRAAALAAAQRAAVELVVGVYVNGKTRVDKAVAVENTILAQTSGYVKRYEILKEGPSGEWYTMRIRALVATGDLRKDLESLGLLKRPEVGNPRVAILLTEYIGESVSKEGFAARALTQVLLDKGFKVMALPKSVDPEGDPVDIARSISRNSAELLVTGLARAQSLELDRKLGGMSSLRASITARVIETGSGDVLATFSQVASGIEGTREIAAQKAFEKAAELCGEDVAKLPQELSRRAQISVTVVGLTSFEELSKFQKGLAGAAGVKDLFLRSFNQEEKVAALDVLIDQLSAQDLADQAARIGGPSWTVLQVVGRTVRLNASPAGR